MAAVEEWQADFDIPEGQPIGDKEDEDWDIEMDLGKTGGAKAQPFIIRPALDDADNSDDDEGVSTIKVAFPKAAEKPAKSAVDEGVSTIKVAFPKAAEKPAKSAVDDDIEDDFALPSDLTKLSLAPLTLNHRSSKSSIEWGGDKDHTSSSQSSDAYSSLGFADASPSSNSTSCASLPETETEDEDDEEGDLEGLVIPTEVFDSGQGGHHLTKLLEMKKATVAQDTHVKIASPDPEDDFEIGLIIDEDVDLSPSRLLYSAQQQSRRMMDRSNNVAAPRLRPSKLKPDRAKSPVHPPPISSARQLQKLRLSPSPPLQPISHAPSFQPLSSAPPSSSFLSPKSSSLRGQKSHSGLKPFAPTPEPRRLPRKASLSSLMESSQSQASGSSSGITERPAKARYEEPTAASRAKSHKASLSRLDYKVPPTRPSTPSSNPAALRLTMPTQSRLRSRPTLSSVGWNPPPTPSTPSPSFRTSSPLPPRPPSSTSTNSLRSQNVVSSSSSIKVLKRPKRPRLFGDGTELDGIEDLPTNREKESRFHVQPKGYGNRIPGGSYPLKVSGDRNTIRKKSKREIPPAGSVVTSTSDVTKKTSKAGTSPKKKKNASATPSRRKPTLIRNLSGVGPSKVVGDMKWNPQALRWEGNEQVLREFDAVVTSTRPALITHLTGSSIGSPVSTFATGARIVGNMMFDPKRMCWLSTLPPEEDEPDVFANLADDEEDGDGWESKGGTIRASLQSTSADSSTSTSSTTPTFTATLEAPSPARSLVSDGGSDRGSRASVGYDTDADFVQRCRSAEERHRMEMKGWRTTQDVFAEPNRTYLYEIRAVATRSYSSS